GVPGHAREDLTQIHAWNIGGDGSKRAANLCRRLGLGVPGVDVAGPADQEQHDAIDVAVWNAGGRSLREQVRQRQAEHRDGSGMKEVAPGQAIAKMHRAIRIQSQHRWPSSSSSSQSSQETCGCAGYNRNLACSLNLPISRAAVNEKPRPRTGSR